MPDFTKFTVKELDGELQKRNLRRSGSKALKLERVLDDVEMKSSKKNRHSTPTPKAQATPRGRGRPKSSSAAQLPIAQLLASSSASPSDRPTSGRSRPSSMKSASKRSTPSSATTKKSKTTPSSARRRGKTPASRSNASADESEYELEEVDHAVLPTLSLYVSIPAILLFCILILLIWFDLLLQLGIFTAVKEQMTKLTPMTPAASPGSTMSA